MADRICDNCMSPVPIGTDKCPKCGILFENTNPGGALPNGWVLGGRYTVGRYIDIDGEGVLYSAIDGNTLQRVTVKEFMPVTLCASRSEAGAIQPKPGCEVLFKTTRMDFADLYGSLLRLGLVEGLVQVLDVLEENNTAYAVLEPKTGEWIRWQRLEMPAAEQFHFARSACAQWLVEPDGSILLPFYIGPDAHKPHSVTVVRCSFDGRRLEYRGHGNVMRLDVVRGLVEPSLVKFQGRYYLTLRNDLKGYVTVSDDGMDYRAIEPWAFGDGEELGSYNTQQHWLAHSEALFLVYTRRGAGNDHIMRHRAPLWIAQVDPRRLRVMRNTEKILVPERGATLGNFGAAPITKNESWVTVAEGVWNDEARRRGADGSLFVARVVWSKPNKDLSGN